MNAMVLKLFGSPENLVIEEIPQPRIASGEVLVRVKAVGINRIDLKTRRGEGMAHLLQQEQPMILGWDISGVVVAIGHDVEGFRTGEAVFGTVRFPGVGRAYAEYVAAPAADLAPKPDCISYTEAAAAAQSPLTAWQALVDTGHVRAGERVLIHGGAGGVGHYAVQIAHTLGCHVTATASGADDGFVRSLGADEVIDYKTERFEEISADMDFILDTIGGENFVRSLRVLRPGGTIVLLPSDKKAEADRIAAQAGIAGYRHIMMHSDGTEMRQIASMLAAGSLKTHIARTFPFDRIPRAHEVLEKGKIRGKIVITVD